MVQEREDVFMGLLFRALCHQLRKGIRVLRSLARERGTTLGALYRAKPIQHLQRRLHVTSVSGHGDCRLNLLRRVRRRDGVVIKLIRLILPFCPLQLCQDGLQTASTEHVPFRPLRHDRVVAVQQMLEFLV